MINLNALLFIFLLILVAAYWRGALGVRERVLATARKAVDQVGAQLLDQTVSMAWMKLCRTQSGGVAIRRCYRFEFSLAGDDRRMGRVVIDGRRVRHCELQMPEGNLILDDRVVRE